MADQEQTIEVRLIKPGDRLTGLSVGHAKFAPLKTFLQKYAASFQQKSLARTYAAFNTGDKIVGYITLICGEVVIGDDDQQIVDDVQYTYRHYPAVKIARLATDVRSRGIGVGIGLVELALGIAQDVICPSVGCRFVVVDAKQEAVNFYKNRGFTILDTQTNRERPEPVMFIDLQRNA